MQHVIMMFYLFKIRINFISIVGSSKIRYVCAYIVKTRVVKSEVVIAQMSNKRLKDSNPNGDMLCNNSYRI